jgi:hypothetical protein
VALFGGVKPCLTTEPADQMNFDDPADELTARPVAIKNGVGCGTLTIDEVSVDSSPFFSTAAPLISAGASLAGGSQLEATVQYKRPPSGGIQLGTLRVKTNDPNYGPPEHKLVQLISRSPLNPVPVAELRACRPAELLQDPTCAAGALSTLAVQLSALTPKEITLSGVGSYDPDPQRPSARNPVASYKFSLLPGPNGTFPPGVTTSNLTHHAARISDPTTVLSIPAGGTGTYRVALTVYDDRGQASANSAIIGVTVYP